MSKLRRLVGRLRRRMSEPEFEALLDLEAEVPEGRRFESDVPNLFLLNVARRLAKARLAYRAGNAEAYAALKTQVAPALRVLGFRRDRDVNRITTAGGDK